MSSETEIDGKEFIVDGTADYDGFSIACAGLKFDGTIMSVKNKKNVYPFSFEYKHRMSDEDGIDVLRWWYDDENGCNHNDEELKEMAMVNIVSNYDFGYYE